MKNSGEIQIASRYASALFDIAKSASAVAEVEKDLNDLALAIDTQPSMAEFIKNPLLNRAQQAKIVAALAESFGAHKVTKNFLVTLTEGKRLALLAATAKQFAALAEEARGEMSAELVTAAPVSKEEANDVAERLGKAYGKKIRLRVSQDKKLLGGAVIKIGGTQLDGSVAGKLERMNIALRAA